MTDWLSENVPSVNQRYPPMWRAKKHLSRIVRNILLSVSLALSLPIEGGLPCRIVTNVLRHRWKSMTDVVLRRSCVTSTHHTSTA
jgi:hypothetical protein